MESVIAAIGVLVAFFAALTALPATLYIRRREFEDIYVQRYWSISDRIPLNFRIGLKDRSDVVAYLEGIDEKTKTALWDYLALCEDEIDLRIKGQITDETWDIWGPTIQGTMGAYPYKEILHHFEEEMAKQGLSQAEMPFSNLRALASMPTNECYDPYRRNNFAKWLSGRRQVPWQANY